MNNIPESVIQAAFKLIEAYGSSLRYLGEYNSMSVYQYCFPEDTTTGFPVIFLHDGNMVLDLTGFDALDVTDSFVENIGISAVE